VVRWLGAAGAGALNANVAAATAATVNALLMRFVIGQVPPYPMSRRLSRIDLR
jgi:hypothetical protein